MVIPDSGHIQSLIPVGKMFGGNQSTDGYDGWLMQMLINHPNIRHLIAIFWVCTSNNPQCSSVVAVDVLEIITSQALNWLIDPRECAILFYSLGWSWLGRWLICHGLSLSIQQCMDSWGSPRKHRCHPSPSVAIRRHPLPLFSIHGYSPTGNRVPCPSWIVHCSQVHHRWSTHTIVGRLCLCSQHEALLQHQPFYISFYQVLLHSNWFPRNKLLACEVCPWMKPNPTRQHLSAPSRPLGIEILGKIVGGGETRTKRLGVMTVYKLVHNQYSEGHNCINHTWSLSVNCQRMVN